MTTPTLSHAALNLLASLDEKSSTSGSEIRELMDWPHSDAAFRMLVNRLCDSGHVQKWGVSEPQAAGPGTACRNTNEFTITKQGARALAAALEHYERLGA